MTTGLSDKFLSLTAAMGIMLLDLSVSDDTINQSTYYAYFSIQYDNIFRDRAHVPLRYQTRNDFLFNCMILGLLFTPIASLCRLILVGVDFAIPIINYSLIDGDTQIA